MAAIKHKRSFVPGRVPDTTEFHIGEVLINVPDKKIYTKDTSDNLVALNNVVSATRPPLTYKDLGDFWFNTDTDVLFVCSEAGGVENTTNENFTEFTNSNGVHGVATLDKVYLNGQTLETTEYEYTGGVLTILVAVPQGSTVVVSHQTTSPSWVATNANDEAGIRLLSSFDGIGGTDSETQIAKFENVNDIATDGYAVFDDVYTRGLYIHVGDEDYDGSGDAWKTVNGADGLYRRRVELTATEGDTEFTVNQFQDGNIDVFVNGVLQIPIVDYTTSGGDTITMVEALREGDAFVAHSYTATTQDITSIQKYDYHVTQDQSIFTGADFNGNILSLSIPDLAFVFVNGVLVDHVDYTLTSDTLTLAELAVNGDIVTIYGITGSFLVSDAITNSGDQTIDGSLTVTGDTTLGDSFGDTIDINGVVDLGGTTGDEGQVFTSLGPSSAPQWRNPIIVGKYSITADTTVLNNIDTEFDARSLVFINGVLLTDVDYTYASGVLTFTETLVNGDEVILVIFRGSDAFTITPSDQRLKKNIESVSSVGDVIDRINIVSYDWIDSGDHVSAGVIAQELHEVLPEAVSVGDEENLWGVDYTKMVPFLVKEIQDLRKKSAESDKLIQDLLLKVEKLEKEK